MPRTAITTQPKGASYPATAPTLTFVNGDNTNGMSFPSTGKELVLLHNTTGAGVVVTISSVADPFGRSQTFTKTVPANGYAMFGPLELLGWRQADGKVWVDFAATGVDIAVVDLN